MYKGFNWDDPFGDPDAKDFEPFLEWIYSIKNTMVLVD